MTLSRSFKAKECAVCQQSFLPLRALQVVCGVSCAKRLAASQKAKAKKSLRERKAALKRLPELKEEAQIEFRKFIRARDDGLPCVSCGEMNPPMKPGGQWDAGHFLGRGAYPELAFEELNCWRQCKSCNGGGGKYSHKERTVNQKYEEELRRRIGDEKVDWLKGPHEPKKYTREDFERMKVEYRNKRKELERSKE